MNDTIAAIATPPGVSALAVVRLTGADAVAIASRVFTPRAGGTLGGGPARTVRYGDARDSGGELVDETLAVVLPAPSTVTGETVVELTCHGGAFSAPRLLAALLAAGARAARPGEFTERAFLNGRIDLAQAEAVADVIHAETDLAHRLAARQIEGALSRGLSSVAEPLRDLLAEVEARVDFAEDVGESVLPTHICEGLARALAALDRVLDGADLGRRAREGVRLAIVGRPNVGKSSLFNALLGEDRAITSPLAGTTRDTVSERVALGGVPVRIVDTAGLREASGAADAATIERLGIERTRREIEGADVVVWVLDASSPWNDEDAGVGEALGERATIVALNKSDLPSKLDGSRVAGRAPIAVSAISGAGVAALRERIADAVRGEGFGVVGGDASRALVTNARHIEALRRARVALASAAGGDAPGEIVAGEIRIALEALGEVTGEAVAPDLLDRIFARFCVGK